MTEDSEQRAPLLLKGWLRGVVISIGAVLIAVPVAAYVDLRMGLLGKPSDGLVGMDLLMAALAVIGGLLLVSGLLGRWLMWREFEQLNERADSAGTDSVPAKPDTTAAQPGLQRPIPQPPFEGEFYGPWKLSDADEEFAEVAARHFKDVLQAPGLFADAVDAVFKSKRKGRPNWYFLVRVAPGERRWIRVPHAGRRGAGAGTASDRG